MSAVIRRENASNAAGFSFQDVEAEARQTVAHARAEAEQILAAARAETEQLVQARRHEGYQAGVAEGRQAGAQQVRKETHDAAVQSAQAELTRLTQALAAGLSEYERNKRSLIAQAESGLIELAIAIARRVCKSCAAQSSDAAAANVRAVLELVRHQHDVELHVHPAEHALLQEVAQALLAQTAELQHVQVRADPAVPRGGCVLRTRDGTIDATIETQLDRVAAAICGSDIGDRSPTAGVAEPLR